MKTNHTEIDELPDEIDFSKGTCGKFYRPNLKLKLPVYLDDDVQQSLLAMATAQNKPFSEIVNELVKKELGIA